MKSLSVNHYFFFLLCFLFVFSCSEDKIGSEREEYSSGKQAADGEHVLKGCVRIKLKESAEQQVKLMNTEGKASMGLTDLDRLALRLGAKKIERVFPESGKFEARSRKAGLHLWYDVYFNDSLPVSRAIGDFSEIPEIDQVEPIRKIVRVGGAYRVVPVAVAGQVISTSSQSFNDPYLGEQWHYYNDGSLPDAIAGADINLLEAWKVASGSPDVIVSVVDGGIDYKHEDLKDNIRINEQELNGAFGRDDDNNGYKDDIYGWNFVNNNANIISHTHGTHVAGTIAAVNNNGKGVCGVAGGSGAGDGVRLLCSQIFKPDPKDPDKDIGTNRLPAAIKYGADNGAVISQNSWAFDFEAGEAPYLDGATKAAIDYFIEHAGIDENGNQVGPMKGGIVIFAAGNEDKDYMVYPASYEKVLAVASMAPDFKKAYYSNYSSWVDITAPGGTFGSGGRYISSQGVYAILSTLPDNKYGYLQGTSMACPHVSGIAALVVSAFGGPGFTPEMLRERLLNGTRDIDVYNSRYAGRMGRGYIDAALALMDNKGILPDPVNDLRVEWQSRSALLKWTMVEDANHYVCTRYHLYWSEQPLKDVDFAHLPGGIKTMKVELGGKKAGDLAEERITDLISERKYYLAIVSEDIFGNRSEVAFAEGRTIVNTAPVITRRGSGETVLKAYEVKKLLFDVSEPDEQSWSYRLDNPTEGVSVVRNESVLEVTLDASRIPAGEYQFTLTVTDEEDASVSIRVPYKVLVNHPPVCESDTELKDIYFDRFGTPLLLDLDLYFKDEDGESLRYEVVCSVPGLVQQEVRGNQLSLTALKAGAAELTVKAFDNSGASCSTVFRMMARDAARSVDLYPNPVRDQLNIRMGKEVEGEIGIHIYNAGGTLVLESRAKIAPFEPASLDVSKLQGGSYLVVVKYKNTEVKGNIIKL